jgi:hypothetical protein
MAIVRSVHEIEHPGNVSSGVLADEFREKHHQECTKQASKTIEEARESWMVEVRAQSTVGSSNDYPVRFQPVSYYGKTRILCTA